MELLVVILNNEGLLNELLSALVEAGIDKATILDSEGLGYHLAYEVPVFAGLRKLLGETYPQNKTIMAVVEDHGSFDDLITLLKKTGSEFFNGNSGIIFTVPVSSIDKI